MKECTVLLLCLDLAFVMIARWSYLHEIRTNKLVACALLIGLIFVIASLALLALVRVLGGCPWQFQSASLVLMFLPAEMWLWKLIKKAPRS